MPFKSSKSRSASAPVQTFRNRDCVGPMGSPVPADTGLNSPIVTSNEPISATGGQLIVDGTTRYHVFQEPGQFIISSETGTLQDVTVLVVGGGGAGGGTFYAGGGGAGACCYTPAIDFPGAGGPYAVTVGPGGTSAGGPSPGDNTGPAVPGQPSSIAVNFTDPTGSYTGLVTAAGGGGGGQWNTYKQGITGGCGGGPSGSGGGTIGPTMPTIAPAWPNTISVYSGSGVGNEVPGDSPDLYYGAGGGGAGGNSRGIVWYASPPVPSPVRAKLGGYGGIAKLFPDFPAPVIAPGMNFKGDDATSARWIHAVGTAGSFGGGGGGANYYNNGPGYYSNRISATPHYCGGGGGGSGGGCRGPGDVTNGYPGMNWTGGGGGGGNYDTNPTGSNTSPFNPVVGAGGTGGTGVVMVKYTAQ